MPPPYNPTAPQKTVQKSRRVSRTGSFEPGRGRDVMAITELVRAETEQHETKTRNQIALLFLIFIALALLVGFVLSLENKDFTPLRTVWDVSGFFLGIIAGYYFRQHRKN